MAEYGDCTVDVARYYSDMNLVNTINLLYFFLLLSVFFSLSLRIVTRSLNFVSFLGENKSPVAVKSTWEERYSEGDMESLVGLIKNANLEFRFMDRS